MTTTTKTAKLTLRPLPEDWTPPADWERDDAAVDSENPHGERTLGGYRASIVYSLDTERRDLTVSPFAQGADVEGLPPGEFVSHQHIRAGVVPAVIRLGGISLNTSADLAQPSRINAVLEEIRPLAEEFVNNLLPVAGTTDHDWTSRAADVLWSAGHLLDRYPYRGTQWDFPYTRSPYTVDAGAVLAAFPDLIDPAWADATDQQLQDGAAAVQYKLDQYAHAPDAMEKLIGLSLTGARLPDAHYGPVTGVRLHGARAWLHAYRRDQADGLTPTDATRWDGAPRHALRIADDSTDAELTAVARRAEREAAAQGIKLLGAEHWARTLRTDRRAAVRAQLTDLRDQISALEDQLKPARKRRTVLVTRVLGWGEEDTDSGLGRTSGLSHTAIGTIRSSLNAMEDLDTKGLN